MKTVLQINTSMHAGDGQSTQLADRFVAGLRSAGAGLDLIRRDLGTDPVPHLDAPRFKAFSTRPDERDLRQQAVVDYSDGLIAELHAADVIVIGLPMYNFGVPSSLKAYFDHIARAGETFRYSETGPVGLLTGKSAYVFSTRGGEYAGTPGDTQTSYLRDFMKFIGIDETVFIYAEGLATGAENRDRALTRARSEIDQLISNQFALAA